MSRTSIQAGSIARLIFLGTLVTLVPCLYGIGPASAATKSSKPSAPTGLHAIAEDQSAMIEFRPPFHDGASKIEDYYVKISQGGPIRRCLFTKCIINGLTPGSSYVFKVAAVNRYGVGPYSIESNRISIPQSSSQSVSVEFIANGGSGLMAKQVEPLGTTTTLAMNTYTYTGYTFSGWNSAANGSGTSFSNGEAVDFSENLTLYAQWSENYAGSFTQNWSGYVLPSSTTIFTAISAEWTVPSLDCGVTQNSESATWVGTGGTTWSSGSSSGTLLQTGIEDNCVGGIQQNSGVFELFPSTPNYAETFSGFPVSAGDTIVAGVALSSSGGWGTTLEDVTTGLEGVFLVGKVWVVLPIGGTVTENEIQGVATGTSYSGAFSAEWIVEDPSNVAEGGLFTLADFGSITFTDLKIGFASGTWSLSNSDADEQTNVNNLPETTTSAIEGSGSTSSFSVSYLPSV